MQQRRKGEEEEELEDEALLLLFFLLLLKVHDRAAAMVCLKSRKDRSFPSSSHGTRPCCCDGMPQKRKGESRVEDEREGGKERVWNRNFLHVGGRTLVI